MIKKDKIVSAIKKLKTTGFFSIFLANVFSKVIALLGGIVVVRILSQRDYGIYAYSLNAMTILFILNDFGASNATLQYLTESNGNKQRQTSILKFALKVSFFGALIAGLLIILSPFFYPYRVEEAKHFAPLLFLVPLVTNVNSFMSVILRANLKNKRYAILEFSKTFLSYLFLIILSLVLGIKGAIMSQYVYLILSLIIGLVLCADLIGNLKKSQSLEKKEKRDFFKFSITTQVNATLGSILLNVDLFLIGLCLGSSSAVALYKVSSTIPMALSFLPSCVVIYVLPYFVMHNKDLTWIRTNYKKMIKYGALIYGIVTLMLILGAGILFNVLYTNQYNDSVPAFQILMVGFFFTATFKSPTSNVLYAMRKLKYNLIVTISSVICNLCLNVVFIKLFGINGAAMTTTLINIFTSFLLIHYMKKTLRELEKAGENKQGKVD